MKPKSVTTTTTTTTTTTATVVATSQMAEAEMEFCTVPDGMFEEVDVAEKEKEAVEAVASRNSFSSLR